MGVINLTPDSFSDGGLFNTPERALRQASKQLKAGATVLDLGAQSTRPGAEEVGADEEIRRLIPALQQIRAAHPQAVLSVDTFLAPVAEAALEAGANWINDVSGGRRDPAMLPLIAESGCPYVLMHSRGNSKTMDGLTDYGPDVVKAVLQALEEASDRAQRAGVQRDQLIWDPGLGFAKPLSRICSCCRSWSVWCNQESPCCWALLASDSSERCWMNPERRPVCGEQRRFARGLWVQALLCCVCTTWLRLFRSPGWPRRSGPLARTVQRSLVCCGHSSGGINRALRRGLSTLPSRSLLFASSRSRQTSRICRRRRRRLRA